MMNKSKYMVIEIYVGRYLWAIIGRRCSIWSVFRQLSSNNRQSTISLGKLESTWLDWYVGESLLNPSSRRVHGLWDTTGGGGGGGTTLLVILIPVLRYWVSCQFIFCIHHMSYIEYYMHISRYNFISLSCKWDDIRQDHAIGSHVVCYFNMTFALYCINNEVHNVPVLCTSLLRACPGFSNVFVRLTIVTYNVGASRMWMPTDIFHNRRNNDNI